MLIKYVHSDGLGGKAMIGFCLMMNSISMLLDLTGQIIDKNSDVVESVTE